MCAFRNKIADVINDVGMRGERVILTRNRKEIAVIIPIEDLKILVALEDRVEALLAKEALEGQEFDDLIPWEEIKARYGLK
jgi:prevent-host-death family protein